jgi:hypothetical protein
MNDDLIEHPMSCPDDEPPCDVCGRYECVCDEDEG